MESESIDRSVIVYFLTAAGVCIMLGSLIRGWFDPFFYAAEHANVQGIDFFSIPKAFLNLLQSRSIYATWDGAHYGPYATWFVEHPATALFISPLLALFKPWNSYAVFVLASLALMAWSARLVSRHAASVWQKKLPYLILFCTFPTYWMLYVGNMHAFTVLSVTLILSEMVARANGDAPGTWWRSPLFWGLLLSFFTKPLVLLLLPALLLNRETRCVTLYATGIYAVVSLLFLVVPFLNPEGIGLRRVLQVALDPAFVRQHLNIYVNQFQLNEYMRDNAIHWLNMIALSGFFYNHVEIFSLSAFLNTLLGTTLPNGLYQLPLLLMLVLSLAVPLVRPAAERQRLVFWLGAGVVLTFFLSYHIVWEYQYTTFLPLLAFFPILRTQGWISKNSMIILLVLGSFFCLPSFYFLLRNSDISNADMTLIRLSRVIPALLLFLAVTTQCVRLIRRSLSRQTGTSEASRPETAAQPVPEITATSSNSAAAQRPPYLHLLVVALLILAAYGNHFNNSFHFDDAHTIQANPHILDLKNAPRFFSDATTFSSLPANQMYRPLVTLSFAVDVWLGGGALQPFWFHVSNFIWHLVLALMLYFFFIPILRMSGVTARVEWLALFAAAWFGVHTAHAETVNYICARSDSFSTLFVIAAFLIYFYWPWGKRYHIYLVPFLLGAFTKPTALMFAPLLFVYSLLFEERAGWLSIGRPEFHRAVARTLRRTAPAFILAVLFYILQQRMTPATFFPSLIPAWQYAITQPFVMLHYFQTFFLPTALSADSDWKALASWLDYRFFIGMLFIIAMLAAAVWNGRKVQTRPIAFGILWFFIALLPTSSFISLSEVLNDHRLYFPFIGLILAMVHGAGLLIQHHGAALRQKPWRRWLLAALAGTILLLHGRGTWQRNSVWKSEESLWYDVTVKSPKNGRGLMNYGLTQMAKGELTRALDYFERGQKLTPNYFLLDINMGICKNALGRSGEAENHFLRALKLMPGDYSSHFYYGRFLQEQGRLDQAVPYLKRSIALSPGFMEARYALMALYQAQSNWPALAVQAEEALAINRRDASAADYLQRAQKAAPRPSAAVDDHRRKADEWLTLSLQRYREHKFLESAEAARRAIDLKPDYAEAYNNLGAALNELGRWEEAIVALRQALALKPEFQLARNNLAWALREQQKR